MPRRQTSSAPLVEGHRRPPRMARVNPAGEVRSLATLLPSVIGKAEALGLKIVAEHLSMALKLVERRADMAEPKS